MSGPLLAAMAQLDLNLVRTELRRHGRTLTVTASSRHRRVLRPLVSSPSARRAKRIGRGVARIAESFPFGLCSSLQAKRSRKPIELNILIDKRRSEYASISVSDRAATMLGPRLVASGYHEELAQRRPCEVVCRPDASHIPEADSRRLAAAKHDRS
jgi:hypothetical protein